MRILALHGFLGAPSTWDAVLPSASGLRPVLPGHGPAPDVSAASFDAAVDALAASLAEPVIVAGYSMGARLGLALALRHPALVRAAVLAGANPGIDQGRIDSESRSARCEWEDAQAAAILERGLPAFVDRWERMPLFATQNRLPDALRVSERARRISHTPQGAAFAMRTLGLGRQPSLWTELASSVVPITFLAGAYDGKFADLSYRASQVAPCGSLQMIPGVGHNVALEAPDAFAAAITAAEAALSSHEETTA